MFQRVNKHEAPVMMLIGQAVIVTVLSSLFLFMPSVNGSYWLLTALAAQLYMMMYFMMFLAAIRLRIKFPKHRGSFRIPGGMIGLLLVCGIGLVGVLVTLIVSFIPPNNINVGSVWHYEITLVLGLLMMCLPPILSSWWMSRPQKYG
jgi:amino acid transporter